MIYNEPDYACFPSYVKHKAALAKLGPNALLNKVKLCPTYGAAHAEDLWQGIGAVGQRDVVDDVGQAQPDR